MNLRRLLAAVLLAGLAACSFVALRPAERPLERDSGSPEEEVRTDVLSPGASQAIVRQKIILSGYTASIRTRTSFTKDVEATLLREPIRPPTSASSYELDRRMPLPQTQERLRADDITGASNRPRLLRMSLRSTDRPMRCICGLEALRPGRFRRSSHRLSPRVI